MPADTKKPRPDSELFDDGDDDILGPVDVPLDPDEQEAMEFLGEAGADEDDEEDEPRPKKRQADDEDDEPRRGRLRQGDDNDLTRGIKKPEIRRRIGVATARQREVERRAEALEQENLQLRRQVEDVGGAAVKSTVTGLETKLEGIRSKLKAAKEEGDSDAEVDLIDEMTETRAHLMRAKEAQGRMRPRREEEADDGEPRPQPRADKPKLRPITQKWLQDVEFDDWGAGDKGLTTGIDAELAAEGWDPGGEDYYEEMEKRIARRAPHLVDKYGLRMGSDDDDADDPPPRPRREARTPVSRGSRTPTTPNRNTVRLTGADKRQMRVYKLDPGNPDHVREFALNRRASQQESERQRGEDE